MPKKVFNFAEMEAYDFSNLNFQENSPDNCFTCDKCDSPYNRCDCDSNDCDCNECDISPDPTPKKVPDDKRKDEPSDKLSKYVAAVLDEIAMTAKRQNKTLLEQQNNRGGC